MKDLTKLTQEEARNIESVLFTLQESFKKRILATAVLANSKHTPEALRPMFTDDVEWQREMYRMIYGEDPE